jgi:hypothetical protein
LHRKWDLIILQAGQNQHKSSEPKIHTEFLEIIYYAFLAIFPFPIGQKSAGDIYKERVRPCLQQYCQFMLEMQTINT